MKTKYFIQDWAGNDLTSYYGTFNSFEDAWGAIYERFENLNDKELEEQLSEFEVVTERPRAKTNFLDPKDIRGAK